MEKQVPNAQPIPQAKGNTLPAFLEASTPLAFPKPSIPPGFPKLVQD